MTTSVEEMVRSMRDAMISTLILAKSDLGNDDVEALAKAALEASGLETVLDAGLALVEKLDECGPHITNAFLMEQVRGRPYSGPQYGEALEALRAALQPNTGEQA